MNVRTLIVDDEPVARRLLAAMVATVEWMQLIGTADRASTALRIIEEQEPDLVFLDIRLPDRSGIELAESAVHRPEIVFTTAHDEYAIRALQLGAVDYLTKPFGPNRFLEAAERARARLASASKTGSDSDRRSAPLRRLYVRDRDVIVPVPLDRVERIEARGDYFLLCTESRQILALVGISELESSLDKERFLRVHRSHIVNLDHVVAFRPFDPRRYLVVMKSGFEVTASAGGSRVIRTLIV